MTAADSAGLPPAQCALPMPAVTVACAAHLFDNGICLTTVVHNQFIRLPIGLSVLVKFKHRSSCQIVFRTARLGQLNSVEVHSWRRTVTQPHPVIFVTNALTRCAFSLVTARRCRMQCQCAPGHVASFRPEARCLAQTSASFNATMLSCVLNGRVVIQACCTR
jgi:hypothetical protein